MEKTTYYQLNKPEAADPLRVADFNENADIMDAALGALSGRAQVEVGSYTGDGTAERIIDLPFTPSVVLLFAKYDVGSIDERVYFLTKELCFYVSESYIGTLTSPNCAIVENGLQVGGFITNGDGKSDYYIAFR